MIKYEIKRDKKPIGNIIMIGCDFKTINKSELQAHLSDGWILYRKKYFLITDFSDWWLQLSDGNKIAVVAGIIIPIIITLLFKGST